MTLDRALENMRYATHEVCKSIKSIDQQDEAHYYAGFLVAALAQLMDIQSTLIPAISTLCPEVGKNISELYRELRIQKNLP